MRLYTDRAQAASAEIQQQRERLAALRDHVLRMLAEDPHDPLLQQQLADFDQLDAALELQLADLAEAARMLREAAGR